MLSKIRSSFSSKPSTSFQILSDLHLEIDQQYNTYTIRPCAEYLILAGDIGRLTDYDPYRDFLHRQTSQFKLVFLILGNHEFYNETYASAVEKARLLEREDCFEGRLVVLDRRRFDIPGSGISILGCTLWSRVSEEARDVVQAKVKDFQKIRDWTVERHNASHEADLAWLLEQIHSIQQVNKTLQKKDKRSILVVTQPRAFAGENV